jgi:hypothetical protein
LTDHNHDISIAMKKIFQIVLLFSASSAFAQVHNEVVVYVKPGTEVKVLGDFDNRSSGSFTVDANAVLTVDGDVNNSGTMLFETDASLLRGSTSADGGTGTYNVKRLGATGNKSNLWSSPVFTSGFTPGNPSYSYVESQSTQWDGDDQPSDPGWVVSNGNMTPGDGYAGRAAGLVTFSDDRVNNGNITAPLHVATYDPTFTSTTGGTPFNLVGNPYPSALDAWLLVSDASNSGTHGSLYFWDDDGTGGSGFDYQDYAVWNASGGLPAVATGGGGFRIPNGIIATGQGFMVRNISANQLTFKNSMRVANNTSNIFFRVNGENSRLWFSINGADVFNQILVAVNEDATDNEDRLYDAIKVRGNRDVFLAATDNDNDYAILAFPPPLVDRTVPLSLYVSTAGAHTFKADKMEGYQEFDVYFNDVVLNTNVLLEEGTSISVNISEGEYTDRFFLNFSRTSVVTGIEDAEGEMLRAYAANGFLHVGCNGCTPDATIDLLDMSGRLVISESHPSFNGGMVTIPLNGISTGVYVVRITTENQVLSKKIINQ